DPEASGRRDLDARVEPGRAAEAERGAEDPLDLVDRDVARGLEDRVGLARRLDRARGADAAESAGEADVLEGDSAGGGQNEAHRELRRQRLRARQLQRRAPRVEGSAVAVLGKRVELRGELLEAA